LASKVAAEIVTGPNGDPPAGGLKMPATVSGSVLPVGVSRKNCDPLLRPWFFAKPSSTNAPDEPSVERTACDPSFQSRLMTVPIVGSTAVIVLAWPKTSPSPARTFAIDSSPGVFAAAFPALIGIGEKLFCAVIA
jgi:hypothetical protein